MGSWYSENRQMAISSVAALDQLAATLELLDILWESLLVLSRICMIVDSRCCFWLQLCGVWWGCSHITLHLVGWLWHDSAHPVLLQAPCADV